MVNVENCNDCYIITLFLLFYLATNFGWIFIGRKTTFHYNMTKSSGQNKKNMNYSVDTLTLRIKIKVVALTVLFSSPYFFLGLAAKKIFLQSFLVWFMVLNYVVICFDFGLLRLYFSLHLFGLNKYAAKMSGRSFKRVCGDLQLKNGHSSVPETQMNKMKVLCFFQKKNMLWGGDLAILHIWLRSLENELLERRKS